jgi:hypothetical protein
VGHINITINEGVGIGESVIPVIYLNFELYDRLRIGNNIVNNNNNNSSEIIFIQDPSDVEYITGFAIKVKNPNEEKRKTGITLGERTVNYLSALTGRAVRSKRPKIEKQLGDTTPPQTTDTPQRLPNFNLDASKLASLLLSSTRTIFNKRIDNYQSGLVALTDYDLERAMAQFHQVIEDSELKQEDDYYMPLRNACNNHKIDSVPTANAIRNLGIKCTTGEPVDFTDQDNWQQLYVHTLAIRQISDGYIRKILTDSNL